MNENKYSTGKVYKLVNSVDNEIYVGSTCKKLTDRLTDHKKKAKVRNSKVYKHLTQIGWNNVSIELLENFACESKDELLKRERYYIDELKSSLNTVLPTRTPKEYKQQHKEKLLESNRKWEQDNREKRKAQSLIVRQNNRQKLADRSKEYYNANKEKIAQRKKLYRENNKDKIKEQNKNYNEKVILKAYQNINILKTDIRNNDINMNTKTNMDVEKAITILPNVEQIKHFSQQIQILSVKPSTNLKDLFEVITKDIQTWLSTLPTSAQSKSAFRKYKTPLNTLLENSQVQDILGKEFCDSTYQLLKKGFKQHICDILKQRSQTMDITSDNQSDTKSLQNDNETDDNIDTEPDDNSGFGNPDDLEYENPNKRKDYSCPSYLEVKYQEAQSTIQTLQTSVHHLTRENEFLREVIRNITKK